MIYSTFTGHRAPLNRVSAKRLAFKQSLDDAREPLKQRSGGWCEAAFAGCWGKATQIHHRKRRSQGGDNTLPNLLHVCKKCHDHIHAFPDLAYEEGFMVRRDEAL